MRSRYSLIKSFKIFDLWHKDPCKNGDDDSCGWFMRSRHGDSKDFELVIKDFEFNFTNNYWFTEDGTPIFSTIGIVLCMYQSASWIAHKHKNHSKHKKFIEKHLAEIIHFAENPIDSLHRAITREKYYRTVEHDRSIVDSREERIRRLASIVYGDVIRKMRPWYQEPRWHITHWRITPNYEVILFFKRLKHKFKSSEKDVIIKHQLRDINRN